MMDKNEDKHTLDLQTSSKSHRSFTTSMKLCLYEVLYRLYHSCQSPAKISNSKKSSYILLSLYQSIQMVSILSVAEDSTRLWDSYGAFWDILQYLRLDFIFVQIGLSRFLYLLIEVLVLLSIVLFSFHLLFAFYKRSLPDLITKTTSLFSALYCTVFVIPILIVLLKMSLFFASEHSHQEEYRGNLVNLPFAILALFTFFFINYIYIVGSAENRHSAFSSSLDSKSSCMLDIKTLQIRACILAFYVLRGRSQIFYLSIFMFVGEAVISYNFFSLRPHYNAFANKTKIMGSMLVSLSGLAMIMGKITDNAGVFILIAYVANPLIVVCTIWYISGKIKIRPSRSDLKQISEDPRGFKDCWAVERILRPYLMEGKKEKKTLILSAFDRFFECSYLSKDTRLVIWEAYYCLNCLHDERLSRIKISKRMYSWFSFEGDFQAFVCLKRFESDNEEYYEDFDFLKFRLRLEKNKRKDKKLCENWLLLLEEFTEHQPNKMVVENLLSQISEDFLRINDEYDDLCIRYNMNKELLLVYQTYLSDILHDKEKANYIIQRHGRSTIFEERDLNWFDEKNCFMIVSGKLSTLGTITYANNNASDLLKEPILNLIGKNIDDYIPFIMNARHNAGLRKFLFFSKNTKIDLPRSSYMVTSKGNIIEVYVKLRCLAIDSYPMFLVLFKAKNRDRDIIITDKEGNISQYSSKIPSILKLKAKKVSGENLNQFLMIHANWRFENDVSYYTLNDYKIYFHQRKIFSYELSMYRFYPKGTDASTESNKRGRHLSNLALKPNRAQQLENANANRIKFFTNLNQASREENNNTFDSKFPSQNSLFKEQRSLSINMKTKMYMKLLMFSLFLYVFISLTINISNSLYLYLGFDGETHFASLYKIWNLNTALINISNSARNFKITQSETYYNSFESHIKYFQNFKSNQKEIISTLEGCDSRGKIYNNDIFYWDHYEVKKINLVDFSNKFVRYSYDFFEQRETDTSYAFIILNANSYPMEYLLNLSNDVKECLEKQKSDYEFVLFMLIVIGTVIKIIMICLESFFSLQIRKFSASYWYLIVNSLSGVSAKVQKSLSSRLEAIHVVDKAKIMNKSSKKTKWKTPVLPIMKYVWIPIALTLSSVVYFVILNYVLNKDIANIVYSRLDTIDLIGKLNFEIQQLDYWTRETMIKGLSDTELLSLQPFKEPRQHLEQVHQRLPLLTKDLLKRNSMLLLNNEFELFFDTVELNESVIINGIYGNIKMLLMDSKYYSGITENVESEYEKFSLAIHKLTVLQEQVLYDTVDYSLDFMNQFRLQTTIINLSMVGTITIFIILAYTPFIKQEKKQLENKNYFFEVINKIKDQDTVA